MIKTAQKGSVVLLLVILITLVIAAIFYFKGLISNSSLPKSSIFTSPTEDIYSPTTQ